MVVSLFDFGQSLSAALVSGTALSLASLLIDRAILLRVGLISLSCGLFVALRLRIVEAHPFSEPVIESAVWGALEGWCYAVILLRLVALAACLKARYYTHNKLDSSPNDDSSPDKPDEQNPRGSDGL